MAAALARLLAACRTWLAGGAPPPPAPGGRHRGDAATLARLARLHNLEPLLHRLVESGRMAVDDLPPELPRRWEAAYHHNVLFQAELFEDLDRTLAGCRRRGVPVAVFKGPVTAARGYRDPALREMADVDLLCAPDDLDGAVAAAAEAGFEPAPQTADYHLGLRHPRLAAGLEIHFRLYDVVARPERLLDEVWSGIETVTIGELRLPAPAPAAAAVLDVAHLLQHDLLLNVRPFLDLAATLRHLDPPQARRLRRRLEDADLAPEYARLGGLIRSELGVAPPGAGAPQPELVDRVRAGWLEPETLLRQPLLAGAHDKAGHWATARYLAAQLAPPPARLAALHGHRSRLAGLALWPRHLAATAARVLRDWRARGWRLRPARRGSLKAALHRRRRRA